MNGGARDLRKLAQAPRSNSRGAYGLTTATASPIDYRNEPMKAPPIPASARRRARTPGSPKSAPPRPAPDGGANDRADSRHCHPPHSFPSSVSDITSATIPRLTRQRQGARSGPTPIVTLLFASEVSTLSTTTLGLLVFRFTASRQAVLSPRSPPSAGFAAAAVAPGPCPGALILGGAAAVLMGHRHAGFRPSGPPCSRRSRACIRAATRSRPTRRRRSSSGR